MKHVYKSLAQYSKSLCVQGCLPLSRNQRSLAFAAAFGTKRKETSRRKAAAAAAATSRKNQSVRQPPKPQIKGDSDPSYVPASFLLPTASPYVYIAKYAVRQAQLDSRTLFSHVPSPHSGKTAFEYFGNVPPIRTDESREVAFLGKSNVGKSSLLNAMMGQKLAWTSKLPGRTQAPHYFRRRDSSTFFIDLPGYGFAVGPDAAVDQWQNRTQSLLLQRRDQGCLRRVFLLVDARHGASGFDSSIMGWLDEGELPYSIIMTKHDAMGLASVVKHMNYICMRYQHQVQTDPDDVFQSAIVHMTSAKNGTGIQELLWSIEEELDMDNDDGELD